MFITTVPKKFFELNGDVAIVWIMVEKKAVIHAACGKCSLKESCRKKGFMLTIFMAIST